jgi:hypothetical protein
MTDWPTIISDLQAAWGRIELARKAGAGVSTLADLATGKTKEPRHTLGVRLLKLHAQKTGREAVRSSE